MTRLLVTSSGVFEELGNVLRFIRRFLRLAGPYWNGEETNNRIETKAVYWKYEGKRKVWLWTGLLVVFTIAQVLMPIWLNRWNADFFDALEKHSWPDFLIQIVIISIILLCSMGITAAHLWIKRKLQMGWRTWLTNRLLSTWLVDGHHHQVTYLSGEHDNPDGRIAEDIRNATEMAIELAHSLFYCLLLLVGFTQILWSLSGELVISVGEFSFTVLGHLVLIAWSYAMVFSSLALWLAQPLVAAVKHRQTVEADFRFELGRARENSATIALLRGEANERRRLGSLFHKLSNIWRIQSWALTRIMLFSSGYSVLSTAFPLLVAAPRYITGTLTLGALMQTVQAFQQMILALSWPVDNVARVSEWRSSGERVLGLHDALMNLSRQVTGFDQNTIHLVQSEHEVLAIHDLNIVMPDGRMVLNGFNVDVLRGERILISGNTEAAMKLFKAVAGLWPWGRGKIELPKGALLFFLPHHPYVPKGNLRAVVSYPTPSRDIDDVQLSSVLKQVGLEALVNRLEDSAVWEQILTRAELQRLSFARLLLHKPAWIFIEEATDALDPTEEAAIMQLLVQELPQSTVLTISYHIILEAYHPRRIVLN